jgi:uncharacterized membrane protein
LKTALPDFLTEIFGLCNQFWEALRHFLQRKPYQVLLFIAMFSYGVIFAHFTVQKHNMFQTGAWDLGIFNQALYNTLYSGRPLYYTVELFLNPSGCYFAVHLSPILFLVLPFYAILPLPTTLLVLKSFILASASVPLYLLTKKVLKSDRTAFMVALAYLLYPPLQGANWFDFQPQVFLPLFFFSLCYFMVRRRWRYYFPILLLTLMVEEHVVFPVFLLAAYFLLKGDIRSLYKSIKPLKMNENVASLLTMILCVIYFVVTIYVKNFFPINPDYLERYKAVSAFSVLGLEADPLLLPSYVLTHPERVFQALLYDYPLKFLYLVLLFAPLLFLPFRSTLTLGTLMILTPFLLSNYPAYYMIGVHYPLYVLSFLFVATIDGLKSLHLHAKILTLKTILISTLFLMISTSPILPLSTAFVEEGFLMYPSVTSFSEESVNSLHDLLTIVPYNASILTQNHLFPHISNRANAYAIPFYSVGEDYIQSIINQSEYVLLDLSVQDAMSNLVLDEITNNTSHGCYALAYNAILFKRAYRKEPLFAKYTEHKVFSAYNDLLYSDSSKILVDLSANSKNIVFYPQEFTGTFVYGPYTYLVTGAYEVTYTIKVGEHTEGHLGKLIVLDHETVMAISEKDVYGFELLPNTWTNFTLPFTSTKLRTALEFQVSSSGAADIYVDRVVVNRISPEASADFGSKTFNFRSLKLWSGHIDEEGFLIHPHNLTSTFFWYGPYTSLPEGNYTATIFLKTSPVPQDPTERLLTVDVTANDGNVQVVPASVVNATSLLAPDGLVDWRTFTLEFTVDASEHVEFRGFYPSLKYDIYVSFILLERTG